MIEHVDYHVGLLRGFILAHNAPTQILHALDILLTDYRSKAGNVIGKQEILNTSPSPAQELNASHAEIIPAPSPKEVEKSYFWTNTQVRVATDMYAAGEGPTAIAKAIGRSYASVTAKLQQLDLKRGVK